METLRTSTLEGPGDRNTRVARIYQALREAVLDGRLAAGDRVPATRDLAGQLGVARGTVTAAYDRLAPRVSSSRAPGSGTYVADLSLTAPDPAPRNARDAARCGRCRSGRCRSSRPGRATAASTTCRSGSPTPRCSLSRSGAGWSPPSCGGRGWRRRRTAGAGRSGCSARSPASSGCRARSSARRRRRRRHRRGPAGHRPRRPGAGRHRRTVVADRGPGLRRRAPPPRDAPRDASAASRSTTRASWSTPCRPTRGWST